MNPIQRSATAALRVKESVNTLIALDNGGVSRNHNTYVAADKAHDERLAEHSAVDFAIDLGLNDNDEPVLVKVHVMTSIKGGVVRPRDISISTGTESHMTAAQLLQLTRELRAFGAPLPELGPDPKPEPALAVEPELVTA